MSKLVPYSLGIVAENKKPSSMDVEVVPIEDMNTLNGELTPNIEEIKTTSKDSRDGVFGSNVKTTATVKATWFGVGNDNRKTSPDVRRGEKVILYKFADTDKFYWTTWETDFKIRRLETVIYAFCDERQEDVEMTHENSYWIEISTHKKIFHLHTSKSDGEPFIYDIQVNAKEGIITIQDDVGNFFQFNSKDTRITINNADGSFLDVFKKLIHINCENFLVDASKDIIFNTDKYTSNTNTSTVNGDTTVNGNTAINGGSLTHNGTNVGDDHTHGGVASGLARTSGPG